jgi:hypothetical protein
MGEIKRDREARIVKSMQPTDDLVPSIQLIETPKRWVKQKPKKVVKNGMMNRLFRSCHRPTRSGSPGHHSSSSRMVGPRNSVAVDGTLHQTYQKIEP